MGPNRWASFPVLEALVDVRSLKDPPAEIDGFNERLAEWLPAIPVQPGHFGEVNACPGLRMHLHPSHGRPRAVGESIVDLMFAGGETGRIPIVAVTGDCGNSLTSRLVVHILEQTGSSVGMAVAEGLFVKRRLIENDASDGFPAAQALLVHPLVEAAVFQTEPATVLGEGLPFDLCDVAIALEAAAADGAEENEGLLDANRCLLESVAPQGAAVLNADDPLGAALGDECDGELIYFSHDEHHPRIFSHQLNGGRIVFLRDHCILAAAGAQETVVAPLDDVGFTYGGLVASQIDSALAAVAACWAVGVSWPALRAGLESFAPHVQPFLEPPADQQVQGAA
jgi:cyanophycin synthetase